jgi:hypothetical protein
MTLSRLIEDNSWENDLTTSTIYVTVNQDHLKAQKMAELGELTARQDCKT